MEKGKKEKRETRSTSIWKSCALGGQRWESSCLTRVRVFEANQTSLPDSDRCPRRACTAYPFGAVALGW